mgnify:CR=1 FL=1
MSKILLREYYELCDGGVCQDLLTESEKRFVAEGGCILSGVMQRAARPNGNGRVYSENILRREVESYQKIVKENRALGELDHPDNSVVSLERVSHKVTSIWMEDNDVFGKIQVLDTAAGKTLRALVEGGCSVGISSRGVGSVREQGGQTIVEDDFQLICFDMVSEPSTPGAFMVRENKQLNEAVASTKADRINRTLTEILMD